LHSQKKKALNKKGIWPHFGTMDLVQYVIVFSVLGDQPLIV